VDFAVVTSTDALNDEVGDLLLTSTGDVATVTGRDAVVQHVRVRLRFFKGECFADLRLGFPWREEVLGKKNPNLERIRALVRRTIETTPGIREVNELSLSLDRRTRRLTVAFRATTKEHGVIDSSEYAPFLLGTEA
jgi:hypothetical protein